MVAYDMLEHTVLRPVFFAKATSDRIEIRTADELVQFAADVNAGTGAQLMKAVLMNDIDLKDVAQWTPIGNWHIRRPRRRYPPPPEPPSKGRSTGRDTPCATSGWKRRSRATIRHTVCSAY